MSGPSGRVTIKSIAEALGVSFSTVSKALNDDPNVSDATKRLVREKAREMRYVRNYYAKSLRSEHSKTIAVLFNDLELGAYSSAISRISANLFPYGYTTIICNSQYNTEIERLNILNILARMPEIVVYSPCGVDSRNLELFASTRSRTLILDSALPEARAFDNIRIDHRLSGYLSASHMLACGHRKSLVLVEPPEYAASGLFLEGIRQAYAEHGLALDDGDVCHAPTRLESARDLVLTRWRDRPGAFSGAICFCDSLALGVYDAARRLGLRIPEDISVIGYDDTPVDDFVVPRLTTVHMPVDELSQACIDFCARRLVDHDDAPTSIVLSPHLVVRDSVCARA